MKILNQNVFFISDLHLGHENILQYDNRPYKDLDEMHNDIVEKWNSVVKTDSTVFYLGDFCMKFSEQIVELLKSLNGTIHFIMGNHDRFNQIKGFNRFEIITPMLSVLISDSDARGRYQQIEMCHFPLLVWNKHHKGSWHLHGHCHHSLDKNSDYYKRKVIDVGCNGIGYTPISYSEVKEKMSGKIITAIDHHD